MKKVKAPIECKTFNDICNMPRDNLTLKDFWILTDGYEVTLARQKLGHEAEEIISIPKAVFNKFARWYMTGRMVKV